MVYLVTLLGVGNFAATRVRQLEVRTMNAELQGKFTEWVVRVGDQVADERIQQLIDRTYATEQERKAAKDEYATDECEIDEDAYTSHADDGYWVSAWVWIAYDLCDACEGTIDPTTGKCFDEQCRSNAEETNA